MFPNNYECEGQLEFEWNVPDTNVGDKYTEENFKEFMNEPTGDKRRIFTTFK